MVDGQACWVVCVGQWVLSSCSMLLLLDWQLPSWAGGLLGLASSARKKEAANQRQRRPCPCGVLASASAHKKSPSLPSCSVSAWVAVSELPPQTFLQTNPRFIALVRMGTGKKEAARKTRQGKVGDGMANVKVKGENFYRFVPSGCTSPSSTMLMPLTEMPRRSRSSTSSPREPPSATPLATSQKPPSSSRARDPRLVSSQTASGSPTPVSFLKTLSPLSVAPYRLSRTILTHTCSSRTNCL